MGGDPTDHATQDQRLPGLVVQELDGRHAILGIQVWVPGHPGQDVHHLHNGPLSLLESLGDLPRNEEGGQIGIKAGYRIRVKMDYLILGHSPPPLL